MHIIWFTWKDRKHPEAGGAEHINEALAKELVNEGHEVVFIVSRFKGANKEEMIDGYKIIRVGNRYTVYIAAFFYYMSRLRGWSNLVIEEINTMPFMTQWYTKERRVLLIYQLCREIWFYQFVFPFNLVGYILEPAYLWLLRKNKVMTESQSTKNDLKRYGFSENNISIFPICIDIKPLVSISDKTLYKQFTVLSLGTIRSMKKTLDQIQAFEIAKKTIPELKMKIAGKYIGSYGKKVKKYIYNSPYAKDIEYLGMISKHEKKELLKKSHIILVTSVKEGWGLIVSEAASQGTPAIVYDVDGLRDSVLHKKTGIICKARVADLSSAIVKLYKDKKKYMVLSKNALQESKKYTIVKSYNACKHMFNV
ncbi:glycosyltransferase family 4 protein [Candidatus Woesebacteria bacterium]|nr:glycosyltransferase family 4 protein [Candidatus Woesebacteria bacterium]